MGLIMNESMDVIKQSLQNSPILWKGDYPYFIHPLTDGVPRIESKVLKSVIDVVYEMVNWKNIDIILGIEAMGLPICSPLALKAEKPLVVCRKRSYGMDSEVKISQETGYSKGELFLNDISPNERVLIVDDVLSTGGTMRAVFDGVIRAGATTSHMITLVEKGEGMKNLQNDYPDIKIESIIKLEMDGDNIILL